MTKFTIYAEYKAGVFEDWLARWSDRVPGLNVVNGYGLWEGKKEMSVLVTVLVSSRQDIDTLCTLREAVEDYRERASQQEVWLTYETVYLDKCVDGGWVDEQGNPVRLKADHAVVS